MMSDDSLAMSTALSTENAHIGGFSGPGRRYAVAHEGHHVLLALQSVDDVFPFGLGPAWQNAGHTGSLG